MLGAAGLALAGFSSDAEAAGIIKRPGAHAHYGFEFEPHLMFQYHRAPAEGAGIGARFNIPLFHNGPIDKINNNMAIGFGADIVFWDNDDFRWRGRFCRDFNDDCDGVTLWFPVVLQWNFFLTDIISVFGEPGIAARYWDSDWGDDFDPVEPIFGAGARFQFSDTVGLTVRLGTPYASVGANFLF